MPSFRLLAALGALVLGAALPLSAQEQTQGGPETIRGRVVDDSARAVVGAQVFVTRGPDRLVQQTATDSAGNWRTTFAQGTGDYLVAVVSPGFVTARRRVTRQGTERELVANFTLARNTAMLATVRVEANRPVRASNQISPFQNETAASEKWSDGVAGQVPPSVAGDLAATAGTTPGVTMGPNGPAILGNGGDANLTTLNGMGMSGASIPRAARTETRVTGTTYDATRGGFSGANVDVRLGPGSRDFQQRRAFGTLDLRALQRTDAIGRATGAPNDAIRASVGADGELIRQALTYNVALDYSRTRSDPATLLTGDPLLLDRAGVARDSLARLTQAATSAGIPLLASGVPARRERDAVTWLGRLDDTRDSLSRRALTSYVGWTREGAQGFGTLSAPSSASERTERSLGAQFTLSHFMGPGRRILNETRLNANRQAVAQRPYLALPAASVLVRSATEAAASDVASIALGGGANARSDEDRWTLEGANETIWNAGGRRHRFKALGWGRVDGERFEGGGNLLGAYSYNSVADLAAGRPASFSRTLSLPERSGTVWNAATAIAHQWSPTRFFNVLYGARVEANGVMDRPPVNAALEQALGVRTGMAPTRLHVSPRAGFSWTYSRSRQNGEGTSSWPVGRFYRSSTGVIRGGIGEFRELLRPGLLAEASAAAGLPGGVVRLSCVGAAVPVPDWSDFEANPASIPDECANGGGVLAERAPSATLIDPSYDVPRSWRATLDWNTNVTSRLIFRVATLASYDLNRPGTVDANFAGTPRFTLDGEGGRPVFVDAGAIDAASGAVSPAGARRSADYGRVAVRRSDLKGRGGQVTFTLQPDVFRMRGVPWGLYGSVAWTLQKTEAQYRGFDGANFGDPSAIEWAPGRNDARHVVLLQGGFGGQKAGYFTFFARLQSGLPYTPIVQGDVDGDGRGGDRAYVPAATDAGDAALAAAVHELRTNGASWVRECLAEHAGRVAGRMGCRGPWTQSLNLQWRPPMPRRWARRVTPSVYFQNPLAGLDQLLHGSEGLRGWGSQAQPDPVLLYPRGFDAATRRFRYDVNPRFGDTRASRTLWREPFRITVDFSLNLSTDYPLQQLRRALEPVKQQGRWQRRSADSIAAFYLRQTSNVHALLLSESDSLLLTPQQTAQLRQADSAYSARVQRVYLDLARYLATLPEGTEPGKATLDSTEAASRAYWKIFWEQPEIAAEILTPIQRDLIPMINGMVAVPRKDRENSQWQFGFAVRMPGVTGAYDRGRRF